jgi:hypothetical protein
MWAPVHCTSHTYTIGDDTPSSVIIRSHCLTSLRLIIYFPFYVYQAFYFKCRCKAILLPLRVYRLSPPHLPLPSTVTSSNDSPIHMCHRELVWLQITWSMDFHSRLLFKKRNTAFLSESAPVPKWKNRQAPTQSRLTVAEQSLQHKYFQIKQYNLSTYVISSLRRLPPDTTFKHKHAD